MALLQVLGSPRTAFEKLREKGKGGWVVTLIILVVLGTAVVFLQWPLMETLMNEQFEAMPTEIPAEQLEVVMNVSKYTAIAGAAVGPVFNMFFVGLLLYLLNLIVRGEGGYMQLAKVALYSSVPTMIGLLLSTGLALLSGAQSIYDVSLTGGAFFEEKSGFAFAAATTFLDPFAIWDVVLLVIGASVMMRRPANKVAPWIVIAWALVRLGSAVSLGMQPTGL